jgi:LacI family transcriptional regulator
LKKDNKKKANITVKDIADSINISASTVSRALNNHPKISQSTKEKVWAAAKKLGYQPNIPAYMNPENSKTICFLVPEIDNAFYIDTIESVQNFAKSNNYNLYVAYSNNSIELEKSFARSIIKLNIEGVIIGLFDKDAESDHLAALISHNIPTVFINNTDQNLKAVNISPDISHGSYLAVNHLISMGCKSISVLINDRKDPYYADIIEGYSSAISASDLTLNQEMIYEDNLAKENVYNYLDELYKNSKIPDGIISPNNYTSNHILSWLKKKNLKIPNDLLFVGFSNDKNTPDVDISLTTVQFSGSEIGEKAAKILFEQIGKNKVMDDTIIIPAKFIIKGSSLKIMK